MHKVRENILESSRNVSETTPWTGALTQDDISVIFGKRLVEITENFTTSTEYETMNNISHYTTF